MATSDKRAGGGDTANLRITLKYSDAKAFVEKFATNVSRGGIFIASRAPKPVGTHVRFELLLADGKSRVLKGEGSVAWVREFDARQPNRPHGMGIKFARLDAESRKIVDRILAFKQERGVKEDSAVIPLPTAPREDSVVTPPPSRPPTAPPEAGPPTPAEVTASSPPIVDSLPAAAAPPPPAAAPSAAHPPVAEGSAPRRLPSVEGPAPASLDVSVAEIDALLAADGPALDATLARALVIARSTASAGGAEMDELEALLRRPDPDSPTSVADAVAGLASLLGGTAPRLTREAAAPLDPAGTTDPSPAEPPPILDSTGPMSAPAELEAIPEGTHEIVLEADAPDDPLPDAEDTSPLSLARIVAAASSEPQPPPARNPFAAEDLGAGELDPLDLEGLELESSGRPGEIEPLPPPPHSAPHFRVDPAGLEETGAGQEPARAATSPVPEPVEEEIEISGPEYGFEDDNDGTIVAPIPQFLDAEAPAAQPAPEAGSKPEKKGFFSKLFKK